MNDQLPTRYTDAQMKLMRATVAKDCNDGEFLLFLEMAQRYGADPFTRQIYAIVVHKDNRDKRQLVPVMAIDFLRARTQRAALARGFLIRPNEEEPEYTFDEADKSAWNPLGLVKAKVVYWESHDQAKTWNPVAGVAYWDEFAPLVPNGEWVDTGEVWADSGKPKRELVPDGTYKIAKGKEMWLKMPRNQLAKCAEGQTCRKVAPDDVGGLYTPEEMDRPMIDITAEVERLAVEDRFSRIGGNDSILIQWQPEMPLDSVKVGRFADRVLENLPSYATAADLQGFRDTNAEAFRQFWALAKADALDLKVALDARASELGSEDRSQKPEAARATG